MASQVSSLAAERNLSTTGDTLSVVLIAVTPDNDEATLNSVNLVSVNTTQNTATLIEMDAASALSIDGEAKTLAQWYKSDGIDGVAYAVAVGAATSIDNTVVAQQSSFDQMEAVVKQGSDNITADLMSILDGVEQSNLGVSELYSLATDVAEIGFDANSIVQIDTAGGTTGFAQEAALLDQDQLARAVGSLK